MENVEWAKGPDFAEIAEALAVRTDQIVGMASGKFGEWPAVRVAYTPEPEDPDAAAKLTGDEWRAIDVYGVVLARDDSGIYRKVGEPRVIPGFFDSFADELDRRVGE